MPNSNITYNNTTIQTDFLGQKILQCKNQMAATDIVIGGTKTLVCKDRILATDININSIIYVGPKPTTSVTTTYNGSTQTNGYSTPTGVNMTGNNSGINAGTYTATYTPQENYYWNDGTQTTVNVVFTIAAKSISGATITLGSSLTYNGSAQTQAVSSVVIDGLTATYSVSGNSQTNAESYTLTCTGTGNFTGTQTKAWSIAQKSISGATVTLSETSKTYNGSTQSISISSVKISGLTVTYSTGGTTSATNAGTYTVTAVGNGNFTGTASANWVMNQAAIDTLTLNTTSITYNAASQSVLVSTCKGNGVNATYSTSGTWSAINVGSYTATVTGTGNFNGSKSVTWNIVTLKLTIPSLTNNSKTYNGSVQSPTINNYNSTYENQSGTTSSTNAGSWIITWSLKDTTNTQWSDGTTGNKTSIWTIAKAAGWCNLSAYSFEFDSGNANTFTISASGTISVASSSGCTVSISGTSGTVTGSTVGSGSFQIYSAESQNYLAAYSSVASVSVLNPYFYMRIKHYLDRDTCWGDFYAHNGVTFYSHFGGSGSINCSSHSSVAWIRKINLYPATETSSRPVRIERYYNPDITSAWRDLTISGDSSRVVWSDHIINRYLDYTYRS